MRLFGSDARCVGFYLLMCLCLLPVSPLRAQGEGLPSPALPPPATPLPPLPGDSAAAVQPRPLPEGEATDSVVPRYVRHADMVRRFWACLTPQYLKVQYAGSIGLMSIGTGWDYGKRNRWETDILLGFTPKYEDTRIKVTLTLREQFTPWSLQLKRAPSWSVEPLTCGLFVSTTLDSRFWGHEPGRYPNGYYNFSSKIRINLFLGQQVTLDLTRRKAFHRAVSLYYQLSISDLNLVSAWGNSYLRPADYLSLAFGLKLHLLD